jgi:hypothetical protein
VEYHTKYTPERRPRSARPIPSRFRRRARWQGRAATASASERGARTATANGRVATDRSSRQWGARAGEPATSRISARPGREGGRAGDARTSARPSGESSGLTRSAAARRRRGQDDAATIAATANISRLSSFRNRVEKASGMTVIQAIELSICVLFEATNRLGISRLYAPPTGSRTPPCATRTETTSVAPEFAWTVTTIASCHIRRTTFPISLCACGRYAISRVHCTK